MYHGNSIVFVSWYIHCEQPTKWYFHLIPFLYHGKYLSKIPFTPRIITMVTIVLIVG